MKVSWNWLQDYVDLPPSADEVALRLAMAGLNHESTQRIGEDLQIHLEVTSNRADCLGHLGVAREIAALWRRELRVPVPQLESPRPADVRLETSRLISVEIQAPELCPRYIARVIRGVRIGPSPKWLVDRLQTIGVATINNVVDVTNYVMMECGQPLHAFDLSRIGGGRIIVRRARPGEPFEAIDHKQHQLNGSECVIADAHRPVALAGVMGGVDSEVTPQTVDLLIEAADFNPMSVRATTRRLRIDDTQSSYRFQRRVDPHGVDWASRRACQLILELAGGELAAGAVDCVGDPTQVRAERPPIVLRWEQVPRVLGIDPPHEAVRDILERLGMRIEACTDKSLTAHAPSWRGDLTREIDLIEEVARIYGYDEIPEDARVPMTASQRTRSDRVLEKIRHALTAGGFDEAVTPSVVDQRTSEAYSPWCAAAELTTQTPLLRGADRLRRSLIPSLLLARQTNHALGNSWIELFETAKVYLPREGQLPDEPMMLGLTSGRDFLSVKGVVQAMLQSLGISAPLNSVPLEDSFFQSGQAARLTVAGRDVGLLGNVSAAALKAFQLRHAAIAGELRVDQLMELAQLVPQATSISPFPSVEFDLNLVVAESLRWSELAATVTAAAGPEMESLTYRETYRDPQRDGADRKRMLLSVALRADDRTLTGEEAEEVRRRIVDACRVRHAAQLLVA